MQAIESVLFPIVSKINEYLSNYILVFLLIGVGLWYSIKTRFVQVRCFGEGMRKVFGNLKLKGGKQDSGMSSFQAVSYTHLDVYKRQGRGEVRCLSCGCCLSRRPRRPISPTLT